MARRGWLGDDRRHRRDLIDRDSLGPPGAPSDDPLLHVSETVSVADRNIRDLQLVLQPGARVKGFVQFEGTGTPPDLTRVALRIEPAGGRADPSGPQAVLPATFTSDHKFTSEGLLPGRYLVRANAPPGWTFKGATYQGRDISESPVELTGDIDGVVITYTNRPSAITGNVTAAAPADPSGAQVVLFPVDPEAWMDYGRTSRRITSRIADAKGGFSLTLPPPGEYWLVALADEDSQDWQNPARLKQLAGGCRTDTCRCGFDHRPVTSAAAVAMTKILQLAALVWCCLGSIASGQAPARDMSAQAMAPPSGTGAMSGVVVDPDGKPVRRAFVRAAGDMRLERSIVTDDEGKFSFVDLPSGRFTLSAEKTGYPRISYGAKRPFRAGSGLYLQEGQKVTCLTLTLAPGSGMTGVVYDEQGEPMPGVPVQAWEVRTTLSGERTIDSPSAGVETMYITDEQGRYRIYGLAPGDYVLGTAWFFHGQPYDVRLLSDAEIRAAFQAQAPPVAGPAAAPPPVSRSNYAPSFAPGVVDPLAAGVHSLAAGEMKTGVDLRMQFQPMSSLDAQIVNPDGSTSSSRIALMRRLRVEALNTTQVSSATDRYRSGSLSPGDYTIMAQLPPQAGKPSLWAMADFVASGGEPIALSLFLQPTISVKGTVRFEGNGQTTHGHGASKSSVFAIRAASIRNPSRRSIRRGRWTSPGSYRADTRCSRPCRPAFLAARRGPCDR